MFHRSIRVLAGCKWSASWCLRGTSSNRIARMVRLIYCKMLLVFFTSSSLQEPLHWGIHSTRSLREETKGRDKTWQMNIWMSECSSVQRCWCEGKVLIDSKGFGARQGRWTSKIMDFVLFQSLEGGVLRGGGDSNLAEPLSTRTVSLK